LDFHESVFYSQPLGFIRVGGFALFINLFSGITPTAWGYNPSWGIITFWGRYWASIVYLESGPFVLEDLACLLECPSAFGARSQCEIMVHNQIYMQSI